jgi:Ni,Fe-hydrogenase III small subunit
MEPKAEYFRVALDGSEYRIVDVAFNGRSATVVVDKAGRLVGDRGVIEKAMNVGTMQGFFPDRGMAFSNFVNGRVDVHANTFKQTLDLIPVMEALRWWGMDAGPRAVVALGAAAATGGTTVTKDMAVAGVREALRSIARNPRPYVVAIVQTMLADALGKLDHVRTSLASMRGNTVLDYAAVAACEDTFWMAVPQGWAAVKMYKKMNSADIFQNLYESLGSAGQQLLEEIVPGTDMVTSAKVLGKLEQVMQTAGVSETCYQEYAQYARNREEETKLDSRRRRIRDAIEAAKELKDARVQ